MGGRTWPVVVVARVVVGREESPVGPPMEEVLAEPRPTDTDCLPSDSSPLDSATSDGGGVASLVVVRGVVVVVG